MNKIVLIGDLIESQKIKNRARVQKQLEKVFNSINRTTKNLSSKFTITLGDEFQAVFSSADNLFYCLRVIENRVYPVKVRYSIGVGKISTSHKSKAIGMDGPAFYEAREGLNQIKKKPEKLVIEGNVVDLEFLNKNLSLISHLSENWKLNRSLCMEWIYKDLSAKEIAKKIKISERAVYKNITSGGLIIIRELTEQIEKKINDSL